MHSLDDGIRGKKKQKKMTQSDLANDITRLVYAEYEKLKSTNKPQVKSNGIRECTVLASIVAIRKDEQSVDDSIHILTLTTGVKAVPDLELFRSKGKMVHDSHAEILAIRGFNVFLLNEMIQLKNGKSSRYLLEIVKNSNKGDIWKYKWNSQWSLALFISRLPCGDASMDTMELTCITEDERLINISDDDPYQYVMPSKQQTLRGRFNFKKKGYVRTKPGRQDSKMTLSKSCSDKICLRQVISLNNVLTYSLMESPVFLKYMIIPDVDAQANAALYRCFQQRLQNCPYPIHSFEIISSKGCFIDDISKDKEPSPVSVIKIFNDPENCILEQAIVNGVKSGTYTKPNKPLRKGCESIVSRYGLWKKYIELFPNRDFKGYTYETYKREFNSKNKVRSDMILAVKKCLTKGEDWIPTKNDDFDL